MENPSHISRRVVLVIAGLLVLTTCILVGLNAWNLQKRLGLPVIVKDPYTEGYLAARAKYALICPSAVNSAPYNVAGTIVSVGADSIVIDQSSLDTDQRVDGVSDRRVISISSATKIQSVKAKTAAEISAEISQKPNGQTIVQPMIQTTLSLSDLKPGTRITVTSDENVRLLDSINAVSILVFQQ